MFFYMHNFTEVTSITTQLNSFNKRIHINRKNNTNTFSIINMVYKVIIIKILRTKITPTIHFTGLTTNNTTTTTKQNIEHITTNIDTKRTTTYSSQFQTTYNAGRNLTCCIKNLSLRRVRISKGSMPKKKTLLCTTKLQYICTCIYIITQYYI